MDIFDKTEIVGLLGLAPYDIENPKKFEKIKDILSYFSGRTDMRSKILSILGHSRGGDKLDAVWEWVELSKSKEATIKDINPLAFAKSIQEDLKSGTISKENLQKAKETLAQYKSELDTVEEGFAELERINKEIEVYG